MSSYRNTGRHILIKANDHNPVRCRDKNRKGVLGGGVVESCPVSDPLILTTLISQMSQHFPENKLIALHSDS